MYVFAGRDDGLELDYKYLYQVPNELLIHVVLCTLVIKLFFKRKRRYEKKREGKRERERKQPSMVPGTGCLEGTVKGDCHKHCLEQSTVNVTN